MTFKDYLETRYRPRVVETYLYGVKQFCSILGEEKAERANRSGVVEGLEKLGHRYANAKTRSVLLSAIKQYYAYLVTRGVRPDHPCGNLRLRDKPAPRQLQDLLSGEELQSLLEVVRKTEKFPCWRNRLLISMLVYQGLATPEIAALTTASVHPDRGMIEVPGSRYTLARTLPLHASQILPLINYLRDERPELLKRRGLETEALFISCEGNPVGKDTLFYLLSRYNPLFANKRLNPKRIRQSVIAGKLKEGKDLREVQLFAGHHYASTTEKYREPGGKELQALVEKYHPLG